MLLLDNVSADTTSVSYKGLGGDVTVIVTATSFGGGTVFFEAREILNTGPWLAIYDPVIGGPISVTANSLFQISLPIGLELRARLGGSAGASAVRVSVLP